jgi:hypothetical protein
MTSTRFSAAAGTPLSRHGAAGNACSGLAHWGNALRCSDIAVLSFDQVALPTKDQQQVPLLRQDLDHEGQPSIASTAGEAND